MGSGIAQVAAMAGFDVTVLEVEQKYLDKGLCRNREVAGEVRRKRARSRAGDASGSPARLKGTTNRSRISPIATSSSRPS